MSDDFEESVAYRIVYGAAWRFVEGRWLHLDRLDPDSHADVQRVRDAVARELRHQLDGIDPAIRAEAIAGSTCRRQPRW